VMEEVLGFKDMVKGEEHTYLQAFLDEVKKLGYSTVVFICDLALWCEMARCRTCAPHIALKIVCSIPCFCFRPNC
jgi:hypothetical protein